MSIERKRHSIDVGDTRVRRRPPPKRHPSESVQQIVTAMGACRHMA